MTEAQKTPWHLWAVGILSFLWHCIPVSDYVGFKTKAAWYVESSGLKPWLATAPAIALTGLMPSNFETLRARPRSRPHPSGQLS